MDVQRSRSLFTRSQIAGVFKRCLKSRLDARRNTTLQCEVGAGNAARCTYMYAPEACAVLEAFL